ncbi:Cysteine-rich receptor-like protein kinase [Thalictrum thalictroides]|uniref:non-specific serine/threonine protein kinase n=1 Tax=Thalictrum thalictroides TaxID=46969 RepID=A0A7J6XFW7_THATH|nr:Cysteine-rich receptor-like protein kinase [Thalictrum thalictroides]
MKQRGKLRYETTETSLADLSEEHEPKHGKLELPLFDFNTVAAATNNFSNKLGQGGFGPVYKGKLLDKREIAVKRLSRTSGQGGQEFKNELMLISKLQHRNLVRLLGYCIGRDEKILLYEYMPNKSLDAFLFDPTKRILLDWSIRFNIIDGIARGLLYLHRDSRLKVIHRDLKASNILLDEDMNPKISDFGMARIFGGKQTLANTNRVVGTYGYMSPEYAMEGIFSEKSDVFSFGVLLLEIVTSKKNTNFYLLEESYNLLGYVWQKWNENKVLEIMDPTLAESYNSQELMRCIHIGLLCVQDHASDRPTMSMVVSMLSSEGILPLPKQPAFTIERTQFSNILFNINDAVSINSVTITNPEGR